jgi:hypothetical protein
MRISGYEYGRHARKLFPPDSSQGGLLLHFCPVVLALLKRQRKEILATPSPRAPAMASNVRELVRDP